MVAGLQEHRWSQYTSYSRTTWLTRVCQFAGKHISPPIHQNRYLSGADGLNSGICVSQQIGTLALTKSFASSSCIDSIYAPAVLLPWTTREAATMIILHDNTQMLVVQRHSVVGASS